MMKAHLPATSGMPKEVYTSLYVCICKALLEDDEEWDEAEVRRAAAKDWAVDSLGYDFLDYERFTLLIEELAPSKDEL